MKEYTLNLVTWVPYTQTVVVEAENQDEALLNFGDKVQSNMWFPEEDFVVELDEVEVEFISPEDEDDEDSDVE